MNPINVLLSKCGVALIRTRKEFASGVPKDFRERYFLQWDQVRKHNSGTPLFQEFRYDAGDHPQSYVDFECEFAARHIGTFAPKAILDIGSYRHFILGLLAHFPVTTLDVRPRTSALSHETILTSDAKQMAIPDGVFDAVVSLCTLEHFGLGRYGDELDLEADQKAFREMVRVLRPGGLLLFSTPISNGPFSIAFNAQRIYTYDRIQEYCRGLRTLEEGFFSRKTNAPCVLADVISVPRKWDVYCGGWIK